MELLNILSWISYTVPYDSIPGRLAPLVTILLAMINTVMRAVGESPDKSHFTPLMGFCFVNQIQVENQNKHVCTQKYRRLRCLLRVKGLVIGFYLG